MTNTETSDASSVPPPRILYGTAWKKADTPRLVTQAIQRGFRAIDTACQPKHYDEAGVGAGIAAALASSGLARADLFVQTKFTPVSGQDPQALPYDPRAPLAEQVRQSFEVSLRNLRTDCLDSLVLHSPLPTQPQTLEVWRAMEALAESGRVRQLGLSNCHDLERFQALHRAARVKPAVLQNRFHDRTGYDTGLRAFCRDLGIAYQSFWTLTANPQVLAHATVAGLARRHGRTPEQVFFRYVTQRDVVPLTGTTSAKHMQEDLAIFDFTLDADELLEVDRCLTG
jgi:diketogulonate reductase-like aldo/keto reductase